MAPSISSERIGSIPRASHSRQVHRRRDRQYRSKNNHGIAILSPESEGYSKLDFKCYEFGGVFSPFGVPYKSQPEAGSCASIKKRRRETIEAAGMRIKTVNLILAPSIILVIAVALGIYRNLKRRYYISHASDA